VGNLAEQAAAELLMVRPAAFGFNSETFESNPFQHLQEGDILVKVLSEFDRLIDRMTNKGIQVHVWQDQDTPPKPDAIFPNNWFSTHHDGTLVLYPMAAANRRLECNEKVLGYLQEIHPSDKILDLRSFEQKGLFLEGTGSVVFDHVQKRAYMARSARSDQTVLNQLCGHLGYHPVYFDSMGPAGKPVYHTNVLLSIGPDAIVCCDEVLADPAACIRPFEQSEREMLLISFEQMMAFAANVLVVKGRQSLVMFISSTAYNALRIDQRSILEKHYELLVAEIPTIEYVGGGGIRCMLAELF
jgi:hypothetical protein